MPTNPSSLQARLDAMVKAGIQHHLCPNAYKAISPERWTNGGIYQSLYAVALNLLRQLDKLDARTCEWTYDESEDSWNGTCGIKWVLTEGTPEENEMHFCPGCGAALKGGQP